MDIEDGMIYQKNLLEVSLRIMLLHLLKKPLKFIGSSLSAKPIWIRFAEETLDHLFEQPEYSYCGDLEEDIKTVFKEIEEE